MIQGCGRIRRGRVRLEDGSAVRSTYHEAGTLPSTEGQATPFEYLSGLICVALVQGSWAAFGFRDRMEWNFFSFQLILLVPVLLYLAAALLRVGFVFAETLWIA